VLGSTRQDEAQATQHFTDLESSDTGAQKLPGSPVPLETRSLRSGTRMTPHFSRQSRNSRHVRPGDAACATAGRAAARQARTAAETGSVVARSRYLTAGGAILAALPGATVLEPDEATDGGRSTKGVLGGAGCVGPERSRAMRLSPMTTAHQPRLSIPRPSAFAGPGPSSPRMIQVAVQRRDLPSGLLRKRQVSTPSVQAHTHVVEAR
jgi:hypothetical protein